jgi:dihydrofolate reductase
MSKLNVFNFITLNGFYKGLNEDISWSKRDNAEDGEFASGNAMAAGILLFGRVTYQMMAGWWPGEMAKKAMPQVAEGMNRAQKIVFSRTLDKAEWANTTLLKENLVGEVKKLKKGDKPITILGSGNLTAQLVDAGLVDDFQIMINPIALAKGSPIFTGMRKELQLKLVDSKTFKNGKVLLTYECGV